MPIITNSEYLSENYLPKKLLYRDKEKSQLANNLKNFISTLIYGPYGSGKTSLVKTNIKEITSINVLTKYVDCAIYQTTYNILKEVAPRAKFIFSRSNYELLNELKRETKENILL